MFRFRKPSIKGKISSKLSPKRAIRHRAKLKVPKGAGMIVDPKRAVKNKIYRKTSFGVEDIVKGTKNKTTTGNKKNYNISKDVAMSEHYQDLINQNSTERNIVSLGNVLCSKCESDNWAAVPRKLFFKKVTVMYCEVCGNQDGITYEKFQELTKSNNEKEE